MVLIAGDLFHDNKPSRRTLHKTMDIIRRYTFGPNPVKIQILSNQQRDFRSNTRVNYEDEFYSVGKKTHNVVSFALVKSCLVISNVCRFASR
jgi:double-strand break repair protein MRE11